MLQMEEYIRDHHGQFKHIDKRPEFRAINSVLEIYGLYITDTKRGINIDQYHAGLKRSIPQTMINRIQADMRVALNMEDVHVYLEGNTLKINTPANSGECLAMGDMITEDYEQGDGLTICVGQTIEGKNVYIDLAKQPHMLVGGTTGSGKSMFLHSCIASLKIKHPDIEIYGVDTKRVEFSMYRFVPGFHCVDEATSAADMLDDLCAEMEKRYHIFAQHGYRDITSAIENGYDIQPIVVIIDEFADLIMQNKKRIENAVVRLAQKARAAGIHMIIATQRPDKDVVTGLIKANIPCRVCLKVGSVTNSRIILDRKGGETLVGHGDLLLLANGAYEPIRCQGILLNEKEMRNIAEMTYRDYKEKHPETTPAKVSEAPNPIDTICETICGVFDALFGKKKARA